MQSQLASTGNIFENNPLTDARFLMYLHGMAINSSEVRSGIVGADEALQLLGEDRLTKLGRATLNAWDRYRARFAPIMAKPPARLRATAMHALMVEEMEKLFAGEVIYRAGRALICSVPGLVLQCKKLNDRGVPQNYPTPTALRFARQLKIPGIPQGTRLTVGYILNSIGSDIAEIRLLAQDGNRVAWSREISVNQTVMPIFAPTTTTIVQAAPATKKRTLQAKGVAKAKLAKDKPGS